MSVVGIAIQLPHGQNVEMFAAINWVALGSLATLAVAVGTAALVVVTRRGPHGPNEPTGEEPAQAGTAVSSFIAADVDIDVFVDDELVMRVDHARGFDYAEATVVIQPSSVMTLRAPELNIQRKASQIVDWDKRRVELRVGTDTRASIPITPEQRRYALGTPRDVPRLIQELTGGEDHGARAWAATRLGAIGDRRALPALIAAVEHVEHVEPDQDRASEWVQAQAAAALGELGDPIAVPAIRNGLAQLPNQDHYAYIFEAALRKFGAPLLDTSGSKPRSEQ